MLTSYNYQSTLDNSAPEFTSSEALTAQDDYLQEKVQNFPFTIDQSGTEFLEFIYDEIEYFLSQLSHVKSRCSTPVLPAKQTQPAFGGQKTLYASQDADNLTAVSAQPKKTVRRVNLFAADDSGQSACPNHHRVKEKTSPSQTSSEAKSQNTLVSPVSRAGITLGDFVTPDRKTKHKRTPKKQTNTMISPLADMQNPKDIKPTKIMTLNDFSTPDRNTTPSDSLNSEPRTPVSVLLTKPTRRITPTAVSADSPWNSFNKQSHSLESLRYPDINQVNGISPNSPSGNTGSMFSSNSPQKSVSCPATPDFSEERLRLRDKKAQLMSPICESPKPEKSSSRTIQKTSERLIEANPELVTLEKELVQAAKLLASLISDGKTQNLVVDLDLLIQLLCSQMYEDPDSCLQSKGRLLLSIHNAVFFAIETLRCCQILLELLDSSVVRMLSESSRVVRFQSEFSIELVQRRHGISRSSYGLSQSSFTSVSFQVETDDSKHFPSDKHFLLFKKQRDLFYEIKREWEDNRTASGWSFRVSCSEKVFQLLSNPGADMSNYVHFSRLFVNQLMVSCLGGDAAVWTGADDDNISLLSQLKLSHPEKYKKLRERFIVPHVSNIKQSSSQPCFSSHEAFFKLFIDVSKDVVFMQHLKDCLISKLASIVQVDFDTATDAESGAAEAVSAFEDSLITSRLLAKFLGYAMFQPYVSQEGATPVLKELYLELRRGSQPQMDLRASLKDSEKRGRLVVDIPWIVQYLSHIDPCSLRTSYYTNLVHLLHQYLEDIKQNLSNSCNKMSLLLQYVNLTWLFTLDTYQSFLTSSNQPFLNDKISIKDLGSQTLDSWNVVSHRLIYSCSDLLHNIKVHLAEFVMDTKSNVSTVRKIKPLSAELPSLQGLSDKRPKSIQLALEENFFQNQTPSLKKAVNFIAERVTSSYIKEFRTDHLFPSILQGRVLAQAEAKPFINSSEEMEEIKCRVKPSLEAICVTIWRDLQRQALAGLQQYLDNRAISILKLLLPDDTESYVIRVSHHIVTKQGLDYLSKWLETNITQQYIYTELEQELIKFVRSHGNTCDSISHETFVQLGFKHQESAPSPSTMLFLLQRLASNSPCSRDIRDVQNAVELTIKCITGREDIVYDALKTLLFLLISILVSVIQEFPNEMSLDACSRFLILLNYESLQPFLNPLVNALPVTDDSHSDDFRSRFFLFLVNRAGLVKHL